MESFKKYSYPEHIIIRRIISVILFVILTLASTSLLMGTISMVPSTFQSTDLFMQNIEVFFGGVMFFWGAINFLGAANTECPIRITNLGISVKVFFFVFWWVHIEWEDIQKLEIVEHYRRKNQQTIAVVVNSKNPIFRVLGLGMLRRNVSCILVTSKLIQFDEVIGHFETRGFYLNSW